MPLPFEPAGLPLLFGSLPHTDARSALAAVRANAGVLLAWPQLPRRSFREQMVLQHVRGFPGLVVDEARNQVYVDRAHAEPDFDRLLLAYLDNRASFAKLAPEDAAGLYGVLAHDQERTQVRAIKGQVLGPISLALHLTDEQQRPLIYDAEWFDAVCQYVRLQATWQEAQLGELIGATIICLQEPALEVSDQPFLPFSTEDIQARLDDVFAGLNGCRALALGGAPNWPLACGTSAELIIGDVFAHGDRLIAAAEPLAVFVAHGGMLGFGIVPADADALHATDADALLEHLVALIEQLQAAGVAPALLQQCVVSTTAGLGALSVADAELALQTVAAVSTRLRERYDLV